MAQVTAPTTVIRLKRNKNYTNYGYKYHLINRKNMLTVCKIVICGGKYGYKWKVKKLDQVKAKQLCATCFAGLIIKEGDLCQMKLSNF